MSDLLPEKIWYQHRTEPHNLPSYNAPPAGLDTVEYIRSDLMDAKIESLQRELTALRDVLDRRGNLSKYVDSGNLLVEQKAAITPEMREKAEAALSEYVHWQRYKKCVEVVRDLLGEQG